MAKIEIEGLAKSFGTTQVLKKIDIKIEDGEFVVILGPSGCGKSTLLRIVAGLETASAGDIRIDGRRVNDVQPKDRGCGMVFQNYALYPHMTVRGNIGYGLRIARIAKSERNRRIEETAELLELETLLDRKPAQLSGGQRQRVAIGRALARAPSVFLFDEPLSNLDAKLRTSMRIELRRLHDQLGATSIFVTHDQVEAMTLADRVIILNDGVVEQIGTPKEIYDQPASRFVAGFVGSPPANLFEGTLDADRQSLRLKDGGVVRLSAPLPESCPAGDVVLGIRPEDIRIGETANEAVVEGAEELGSHRLLHCRMGGATVVVADFGETEHLAADRIGLELPSEALLLFDADTGRTLHLSGPTS